METSKWKEEKVNHHGVYHDITATMTRTHGQRYLFTLQCPVASYTMTFSTPHPLRHIDFIYEHIQLIAKVKHYERTAGLLPC